MTNLAKPGQKLENHPKRLANTQTITTRIYWFCVTALEQSKLSQKVTWSVPTEMLLHVHKLPMQEYVHVTNPSFSEHPFLG